MTGCPIRYTSFVRDMQAGLDAQVAHGVGDYFTMKVPSNFTDDDMQGAAEALHGNGRVAIYGLCHDGSRFRAPFPVVRVFTAEGYQRFKREEYRMRVWTVSGINVVSSAILAFYVMVIPYKALSLFCLAAIVLLWAMQFTAMSTVLKWRRDKPVTDKPESRLVPYYDW